MPPANPPIVELVVSAQFATERPADSTKLVLFWNEALRPFYPDAVEAAPLDDAFEKFGGDVRWQPLTLQLRLERPRTRYQFTNPAQDRMVQLQSTRFVLNWMRREADYPRFSAIHREFAEGFEKWQEFAAANGVGEVVPNQWELCYVNFIPQGELWETPDDWHRVSRLFVAGTSDFEPLALEDRSFQWSMRMPADAGRITLAAGQVRNREQKLGLQLTMTARGPAANAEELHERLGQAHRQILELFHRLSTDEAKAHWGVPLP